ncbi:hypothetical protein HYDPIDRAFT_176342 [Hydnomerulius pinastri MD-312]|uniref:Uncharacterized protein n=1 Tax=Hydnomerulius pinastri MD-312 TaxID=994086 RepID=A0A0C9W752_9AGAM|nr:hypothetical protein HYDPIDRAFT_176342 [Hydnomerulius pinastri MD-312]
MMNGHGHGESSGMRTTLHGNPEDLRSYEAAVNARNAGLKLNLVPRRKGTRPSSSASPPVDAPSGGVGDSRLADHGGISRPSSSSSASSLAHAFGVPASHHHAHPNIVKPPPMQGASISLPVPHVGSSLSNSHSVSFGTNNTITFAPGSRESSVASDGTGGTGGSSSDGEVFRPSFKRLPSQTLGPSSSKRALVERGGAEGEDGNLIGVGVENGSGGGAVGAVGVLDGMGIGSGSLRGSTGSRPIAALPERARRASESGGAA